MKAIILAAGRGSRMQGLTKERPKCLTEVRGKSLLDWQIDALKKAGITEIALVTGYKRELLNSRDLVEFHNSRWAETNMVSSLACADSWLQTESCIVSYSDIFYNSAIIDSMKACEAPLVVAYDPNWLNLWSQRFGDPLLDAETFRLTSDNILIEIGNKPECVEDIQGQYMGLLLFTPEGWKELLRIQSGLTPAQSDKIDMTGILQMIITAGRLPIEAIPYVGVWGEIDSEKDLTYYNSP